MGLEAAVARWLRDAGLLAVAALSAIIAFGFLAVALFLGLVTVLPPAGAALITGLAALLVALGLAVLVRMRAGVRRPKVAPAGAALGSFGDAAGTAAAWAVANRGRLIPLALATGFAVGFSPRLRRLLLRLLR